MCENNDMQWKNYAKNVRTEKRPKNIKIINSEE